MLKDKVIIVTGGSGAIGSAICRTAAAAGAAVAFTFNTNEARATEVAGDLPEQQRVFFQQVDASDAAAVHSFVAACEERFGKVDGLVNCLGATQVMPFALIEEADWDAMMSVNLKSMFLFAKAAARGMIRRKAGTILNIGSIAGHRLLEVPVHYAAAKAGVLGFTLSLAKELSRYGIRVNSLAPGLIDAGVGTNISERQLADYNRFCSLGRPGTAEEVAELAAFLISDKASYINAQNIFVDGGL